MSTNAVLGANSSSILASLLAASRPSVKRVDRDKSGSASGASTAVQGGGGGSLFNALYQALTQFVKDNPAAGSAVTTTAAAATSGSTGGTTTATTATTGSAGSPSSSLGQDLHAFLHDLFQALRQAGRSGRGHHPRPVTSSTSPASAPAAASTTPVATTAVTTPVTTTPATSAPATTAPAATTPLASTTPAASTAAAAAASSGIGGYGDQGIISALQALIQDLANSQEISNGANISGTSSNLSANTLSTLNSAFTTLISDLGGSTSGAAASGASGTGASSAAATGTSALQSFLTSFLQDLQNGGGSTSAVGNIINTTG